MVKKRFKRFQLTACSAHEFRSQGGISHCMHSFVACMQKSPESSLVAGTGHRTHPGGEHNTIAPAQPDLFYTVQKHEIFPFMETVPNECHIQQAVQL